MLRRQGEKTRLLVLFSVLIGSYPLGDALLLALHDEALWTVVSLATGWILRSSPHSETGP